MGCSTRSIAAASARRPWLVVGLWVLLLATSIGVIAGIGGRFTSDIEFTSNPESQQAKDLLEERLRGPEPMVEQVIVQSDSYTADDPEFQQFVSGLLGELRGLEEHVAGTPGATTSYYELRALAPAMAERLVSEDRRTTLVPVRLLGSLNESAEHIEPVLEVLHAADADPQFTVLTGGFASINHTFTTAAEEDLGREFQVMPIALLVLILVFGAVAASVVPIVLAFTAILVAMGVVVGISELFPLSIFVQNFVLSIGLAVGIDYALFVVERFREERRRDAPVNAAIEVAADTASRAVLFSGLTVVIALLGMFFVPSSIFRALATGAIVVVLLSIVASLTLLPAVLRLLGDNVNRLAVPFVSHQGESDGAHGFWAGMARAVMRQPVLSLVASAAFLAALSVPYFGIELGFAGASSLPEDTDSFKAFQIVDEEFSAGRIVPSDIVIDAPDVNAPEVQRAVDNLAAAINADPDMDVVGDLQTNEAGDLAALPITLDGDYSSDRAVASIDRLRDELIPAAFAGVDANVLTGGESAEARDFFATVDASTPIVFAFVLGLSFVLLMLVFRSIVVPAKAIVMNLLSVGAAYGALVLVFQEGWLIDVLGFQRSPTIEAWIPLFLFTVLFGLSMDYQVFLLSRIRERYDLTRNNTESVAFGVRSTANIITGAAAIMVVVFGGFALGDLVMFQQMGFGLAVAVFLDATIVRTVLVPSTMRLLGDWNWYLPSWLHWLPDLRVEGPGVHQPAASAPAAAGAPIAGGDR